MIFFHLPSWWLSDFCITKNCVFSSTKVRLFQSLNHQEGNLNCSLLSWSAIILYLTPLSSKTLVLIYPWCSNDFLKSFGSPFGTFVFHIWSFFYVLADGPFMLLLFAGIASLCLAFVELFVYALLRSKRATLCLPSGGPTSSRGGKTCSIIKEELTSVISRSSESKRRSQLEPHINNGLSSSTSPRINRFVGKCDWISCNLNSSLISGRKYDCWA